MTLESATFLRPDPARRQAIQIYFWRVPVEIFAGLLLVAGVLAVNAAMQGAAAAFAATVNGISNAPGRQRTPAPPPAVGSPLVATTASPSRSPLAADGVDSPTRIPSAPRRAPLVEDWTCGSRRRSRPAPEPPHRCADLTIDDAFLARAARARRPWQAWAYLRVFTLLMLPPIALVVATTALLFVCVRYKNERGARTAQFDLWLKDECDWLVTRGKAKLGLRSAGSILDVDDRTLLDEPQRILCGFSPADIEVPDWSHLRFASLREKRVFGEHWRYGTYRLTVVFPLQHHVALYCCDFDFVNGVILSESLADCHYKDVVALTVDERLRRRPPLPRWWHRYSRSLRQVTSLAATMDTIEDIGRDWLPLRDDLRSSLRVHMSSGTTLAIDYPRNDIDSADLARRPEIEQRVGAIRDAIRERRLAHAV